MDYRIKRPCPHEGRHMTGDPLKGAAVEAVAALLTPLVPLLLELGVGVGEFETALRRIYVQAALKIVTHSDERKDAESGTRSGRTRKPSPSAIAVLTGLTRAAADKVIRTGTDRKPDNSMGHQRVERVINGWLHDPEFRDDDKGTPAPLAIRGSGPSFTALVKRYSGEPRVLTIRRELERVKAIRTRSDGRLELVRSTYATQNIDFIAVSALGQQAREFLETRVHNLQHPSRPIYVRRVFNARLNAADAGKLIRDMVLQAEATMDSIDAAVNDPAATVALHDRDSESMNLGAAFYIIQNIQKEESGSTIVRQAPKAFDRGRKTTRKQ
jgi:Family of unknown function (DUF6502)